MKLQQNIPTSGDSKSARNQIKSYGEIKYQIPLTAKRGSELSAYEVFFFVPAMPQLNSSIPDKLP